MSLNWKSSLSDAIRTSNELKAFKDCIPRNIHHLINFEPTEYPLFIPRSYFLFLMQQCPSPVWKQFLPLKQEMAPSQNIGLGDPISDIKFQKTPNLIHRYQNRALFLTGHTCPIICRYCFRKNELNQGKDFTFIDYEHTKEYLLVNKEINEIILTGGDPLIQTNNNLDKILSYLSQFESIDTVRFHTRFPIILPERLDQGLIDLFKHYQNRFHLVFTLHTNHINEWPNPFKSTFKQFRAELPFVTFLAQTVLLKGINDQFSELTKLFKTLSTLGIRPYYLHHPDRVRGGLHFYVSIQNGRKIYHQLKQFLSGWTIPRYVLDHPHGEGKIDIFNPEQFEYSGNLIGKSGETGQIPELIYNMEV
jgi:lysine 2,3-aminomutase